MIITQKQLWQFSLTVSVIMCVTLVTMQYNSSGLKNWASHINGSGPESNKRRIGFTEDKNKKSKPVKFDKKEKTILYWTKMFGSKNFFFGKGDIFKGCPTSSCMGTDDRGYQAVEKFDVLMFHGPELNDTDLPQTRSPHHIYIYVNLETPASHPIRNVPVYRDFFNWTMTYKRDADVMRPYGVFRNISSNKVIPPYIPAQWIDVSNGVIDEKTYRSFRTKSKMAAWFVSHCETNSKRENVVKKLQEYVTVDIYGRCGDIQCPRSKEAKCYNNLETNYFFYLSFENSMCRDYLTEKVYKILDYDVIPVVYGAADYKSFLPPNSYINVLDFPSIKVLADYLIELSQNEEKYLEYFKWKSFYRVDYMVKHIICEFCRVLHQPHSSNQVIEDIYKWWVDGSECIPPPHIT